MPDTFRKRVHRYKNAGAGRWYYVKLNGKEFNLKFIPMNLDSYITGATGKEYLTISKKVWDKQVELGKKEWAKRRKDRSNKRSSTKKTSKSSRKSKSSKRKRSTRKPVKKNTKRKSSRKSKSRKSKSRKSVKRSTFHKRARRSK